METSRLTHMIVMVFPCLHPTVKKPKTKIQHKEIFASTDCLPLQNLIQAHQHRETAALDTFL